MSKFEDALQKIKDIKDKERTFNFENAERLSKVFFMIDNYYQEQSKKLEELKKERDAIERDLIEELTYLKTDQKYNAVYDGKSYNLSAKLVPKFWFLKENEQEAFRFVTGIGLKGIIKTEIHHTTFNAQMKKLYKIDSNGKINGLPEFIKTSTSYQLQKNKKK